MDFKAERVKQINCGKCGESIDPSTVKPLAGIDCPKCGNRFTVPAAFGDFLLVDVLGRGAAGIVCKGFDENLHRQVAIKILRSDVGDEEIVKACQHEARALAALNHPHVVQVHSIGEYRGQPYIVMELLDGGTVEKAMLGQPADESKAVDIAIHAAEGLQAAQHVGLIHMDVKPGNILFDRQGTAKLIDFGVARFGKASNDQIVGTPYYVAPEIVRGRDATHQADIYSLGATLFHLLAARPPFVGSTATEVITQRLKHPAPSLEEFRSDLSPTTVQTVARMMEADPADRYPDYDSLLDDLRQPMVHEAILDIPPSPGPRSARLATAARTRVVSGKTKKKDNSVLILSAIMIAALVLIAVIIVVLALNRQQPESANHSSTWGEQSDVSREPIAQTDRPLPPIDSPPESKPEPAKPDKSPEPAITKPPAPAVQPTPMPEPSAPKDTPKPKPEPTKPASSPKSVTKPKPEPKVEPSHAEFDPFYARPNMLTDNGGWNILDIRAADSQQGVAMTRKDDGSVLATGSLTSNRDVYTLTAYTPLKNITGFRIDALIDPDHAADGAARGSIIVLSELTVTAGTEGQSASPQPIKFANAKSSSHTKDWEARRLLDDKPTTGWATSHDKIKQPHHVVLVCDSPVSRGDMTVLNFTLKFRKPTEAIRRIQISVTTASDPLKVDAAPAPLVYRDRIAFVPLHPARVKSQDKATMVVQEDESILVDAGHTSSDVYTVVYETSLQQITAFQLEAMADDSLRGKGPGTAVAGRFTLSEFEMTIAPIDKPAEAQPVRFDKAFADYASKGFSVERAIDGNNHTYWYVGDRPGESRTAVFMPATPIGGEGGSVLTLTLKQQRMNIGRFRLQATSAPDPTKLAPQPADSEAKQSTPSASADAQTLRLFYNAGGSDAEWQDAKWESAPSFKNSDSGYDLAQGGRRFSAKSVNNPVVDTCLTGIEAFHVKVPNGRYQVTLIFAELTQTNAGAGQRKFSVLAEGKPVRNFSGIDPFADGQKSSGISTRTAVVVVGDGMLDLEFTPDTAGSTPILNALSIAESR
ncbi:protein kinase [Planctomycetales bacterium ZRK34]|nr:protein kinase [Planctomycetales bacterium ZRK34]